jgi:hypothetical protein
MSVNPETIVLVEFDRRSAPTCVLEERPTGAFKRHYLQSNAEPEEQNAIRLQATEAIFYWVKDGFSVEDPGGVIPIASLPDYARVDLLASQINHRNTLPDDVLVSLLPDPNPAPEPEEAVLTDAQEPRDEVFLVILQPVGETASLQVCATYELAQEQMRIAMRNHVRQSMGAEAVNFLEAIEDFETQTRVFTQVFPNYNGKLLKCPVVKTSDQLAPGMGG